MSRYRPTHIAVAPIIVSQLNCEAAAGLKPWKFLQLVVTLNIPHRREGKTVLVHAAALLAATEAEKRRQEIEPDTVDAEVDRILALVGRRRATQ